MQFLGKYLFALAVVAFCNFIFGLISPDDPVDQLKSMVGGLTMLVLLRKELDL